MKVSSLFSFELNSLMDKYGAKDKRILADEIILFHYLRGMKMCLAS